MGDDRPRVVYYARRRIGPQRWRALHRFTALAWAAGVVHTLGEGTDAAEGWFLAMTALVVLPPTVLLIGRMSGFRRATAEAPFA